ncbi:avirulence protein 1b [Phytophthora sojae]|uniref:RxLR effector protein n=2 Tax=Phytophthora sojae TaxID=67593 RepID=G4Z3U5_PHYSP|nr:avirulence protein 1b [Phytophthora sojae]AEK80471.1 Avh13 [Phytophthora sojae]AEK80472.1 Avh13 [Phytophthora sojae]AEK80473.1 Avh13 [Phytophthora sojae]EGZ20804.1 avirulence protein 1b [Phytophthora sojae]|eukprot:XP_009523521.1 avirulence protein 1b [Phytophthora sojae]
MRFSTTLLVVAAAGLFATGHAASDLSQTKIFQAQGVSQFAGGVKSVVTGGRLLRAAYGEDEEERGAWTALLARFPGTTANLARKAEKQTKKD